MANIELVLAYIGFVTVFSGLLFFIPRAVLTIVLVCFAIKFDLVSFAGGGLLVGINCGLAFTFFAFGIAYDVISTVIFLDEMKK
ncbi:MAG: hypothetical protein Q8L47_04920 [bacterium]|nr:hypothetical protein [bacterium]